ncbi:peptidoglycan/LPS O-acetylase OafA/YrhL [Roseiarcus fermentans]|uniref:Peptidoglycan/LPS O-acetylase OafA/YrhL n=1 Tax=Roseiarcus fermentans TaxID=1473586 RepID=A0A366FIF8_9HYPH|nr:acyltransferase family protein [Roseiarcus fermentans]RBP14367.1 peptidoglycan/LPS O-acetylase OafA/YrhL [Roseiarcus fermentans]
MKRSASLDFLRGAAAFAVAVPHYLTANAPFSPGIESVAVAAVEVFFVLSGFVLAPQIVDWVVGRSWRNLGVFLTRRWMRTIPPYVAALLVVAVMTGNLLTADTLRYLFYVENLFRSANAVDFYPVAWSLAVEEWFYLLFAPLLFLIGRALARDDRRLDVAFAILFVLVIAALRAFHAPPDWDLNARRVTLFRIDSIVWGFLLYLALERRRLVEPDTASGLRRLVALGAAFAAASALEIGVARLALEGGGVAQRLFPYASALFGVAAVGFFREADGWFKGPRLSAVCFYLGRISYSAYLFHIVIVMALKPLVGAWPILAQLALYVAAICAVSTVFWRGFERPILAARPDYRRRSASAALREAQNAADSGGGKLWVAALLCAFLGAVATARSAFMANEPYLFYPALVAASAFALALAERAGRFSPGLGVAARAFLLFALALPAADALYRSATGVPIAGSVANPTYSFRAARENPSAFAMWWFYYLNEWIRDDGIRGAIERPDPQKKLPFVLAPGSSGRMFDTTIRINSAGFRGPEPALDKGDRFRIVALGESQTFGPTLRDGERPWPEQLQDLFAGRCSRPVEVINAGTEAYTLEDNLERMRRDVLPLKPDLVLSTHGMNGLYALGLRQEAEPNEPGVRPRASALIGRAVLTIERALHDFRTRGAAPRPAPPPLSDPALMRSRYADAYRKLIALGREHGTPVVLATSSLAVDANAPREVKAFYGAVFKPIDDIIAANAAHNRMVRLIGREQSAPVVEAIASLDGDWDDDLYLDIVHFTERGNARVARAMSEALVPILRYNNVQCSLD